MWAGLYHFINLGGTALSLEGTMNYTKKEWEEAGFGDGPGINIERAEIDLHSAGKTLKLPKNHTWEELCFAIIKALTGKELHCPYRGRGFRSQFWGAEVGKVYPVDVDATGQA